MKRKSRAKRLFPVVLTVGCFISATGCGNHTQNWSVRKHCFPFTTPDPTPTEQGCYKEPAYFGYHATCWRRWPEDWQPCPEEPCGETLIDGQVIHGEVIEGEVIEESSEQVVPMDMPKLPEASPTPAEAPMPPMPQAKGPLPIQPPHKVARQESPSEIRRQAAAAIEMLKRNRVESAVEVERIQEAASPVEADSMLAQDAPEAPAPMVRLPRQPRSTAQPQVGSLESAVVANPVEETTVPSQPSQEEALPSTPEIDSTTLKDPQESLAAIAENSSEQQVPMQDSLAKTGLPAQAPAAESSEPAEPSVPEAAKPDAMDIATHPADEAQVPVAPPEGSPMIVIEQVVIDGNEDTGELVAEPTRRARPAPVLSGDAMRRQELAARQSVDQPRLQADESPATDDERPRTLFEALRRSSLVRSARKPQPAAEPNSTLEQPTLAEPTRAEPTPAVRDVAIEAPAEPAVAPRIILEQDLAKQSTAQEEQRVSLRERARGAFAQSAEHAKSLLVRSRRSEEQPQESVAEQAAPSLLQPEVRTAARVIPEPEVGRGLLSRGFLSRKQSGLEPPMPGAALPVRPASSVEPTPVQATPASHQRPLNASEKSRRSPATVVNPLASPAKVQPAVDAPEAPAPTRRATPAPIVSRDSLNSTTSRSEPQLIELERAERPAAPVLSGEEYRQQMQQR